MLSSEYVSHESDHIGIIVKNKCHNRHKHFCKHIILSDAPILFRFDDAEFFATGMFIESEVYHDVDYTNTKVLVVAVEETSLFAKCLEYLFFQDNDYCEIPEYIQKECKVYLDNNDLNGIKEIFYNFIKDSKIVRKMKLKNARDKRVEKALKIIKESDCLRVDILDEILTEVNLSKSRFSHLFKECVGISFKRYILLKRLEKTFWYSMHKNMSITDAAISAGFSSSAHFSYAFKKNYGITYSNLTSSKY